jgi:hypothetical protein
MRSITFVLLFVSSIAFGQNVENQEAPRTPKMGFSASLQSDQVGILIPIWVDESTSIVPSFQVLFAQSVGLDLGVGVTLRKYLREGNVRPYVAPGFGVLMSFPTADEDIVEDPPNPLDLLVSFGLGGEYFFSDYFSTGVQIGLAGAFSDEDSNRFGNPGNFNLNTSASILVNVYF